MLLRSAIAIIAAGTAVAACGHALHDEGAQEASRSYRVGDFREIDLAGPYDVDVRIGSKPGVSAHGPQDLIDRAVVEVQGEKLVIRPRDGLRWFDRLSGEKEPRFSVTVPQLAGVRISGSGDLHIDHVRGHQFRAAVGGSGALNVDGVGVDELNLEVAGSGDVRIASGDARSAVYQVGGSGDIDGRGLTVGTLDVTIAGSGDVRARATGAAQIATFGSGDVEIAGGARCSVRKAGSGDVRCS